MVIFEVENMPEMDHLRLCAVCVKGQLWVSRQRDFGQGSRNIVILLNMPEVIVNVVEQSHCK